MFTKNEIKKFIVLLGKRVFFPDFTNKLTWLVTGIGISILVTPAPLKVALYNLLIDTFNLNAGELLTISELKNNNTENYIGFLLVVLSLAHNLLYKYLSNSNFSEKEKEKNELYLQAHRNFEFAIKAIKSNEASSVESSFIELNANMSLLASEKVNKLYVETAIKLQEWANLYQKAWPNNGLIQAPDPTKKYKVPAQEAYESFHNKLTEFIDIMKEDLGNS